MGVSGDAAVSWTTCCCCCIGCRVATGGTGLALDWSRVDPWEGVCCCWRFCSWCYIGISHSQLWAGLNVKFWSNFLFLSWFIGFEQCTTQHLSLSKAFVFCVLPRTSWLKQQQLNKLSNLITLIFSVKASILLLTWKLNSHLKLSHHIFRVLSNMQDSWWPIM